MKFGPEAMALASSPTDGPLDDEERALLDSFYQGIGPRQGLGQGQGQTLDKVENLPAKPEAPDDGSKAIVQPDGAAPVQAASEPAEVKTEADEGDDPFAALKSGAGNRSTIDLPGPRASYRVEETSDGNFTVEHLASGEEVRVSGVDYLRFSDLQLHSEFVTRTNPPTTSEAVVEAVSEPEPDPVPPIEAPTPEDSVSVPGDLPDEEPSPVIADTQSPEADHGSAFTAKEDGSITFSANDLLGGTSGPDGGGMRVLAVAGGGNGTLVDNGDDSWTFTPDRAFDGSVELAVTIADAKGGVDTAMATIEITPAPDNPVAGDQSQTASDSGALAAGSVVKSPSDRATMTYSLVSGPAEGTVSVHADGSYSFDPGRDFEDLGVGQVREVSFIYHASDGQGGSDSGIVTISVTGSEEGPVACDRSLVATEDKAIAAIPTNLPSEPTDSDGGGTDFDGDRNAGELGKAGADSHDLQVSEDSIQDRPADSAVAGSGEEGSIAGTRGSDHHDGDFAPSHEDRIAARPAEPVARTSPPLAVEPGGNRAAPPAADAPSAHGYEPRMDDGREQGPNRTDQDEARAESGSGDNRAESGSGENRAESGGGDDRTESGSAKDCIDLSTARNWTVTYANGDSFTANDTLDAGLFTDTAGTIDFGNGDQVSFDNVRRFTW